MAIKSGKAYFRTNLFAALVATCCSGHAWAAPGDVCVDYVAVGNGNGNGNGNGSPHCEIPTATVTTNDQSIDTGAGSVITTDVTASGTVQGTTLTDGAGTTISGGAVNADSGTFTGTVQGQTLSDGAGTTIGGGAVNADSGTFAGTLQGQTLTDGAGTTITDGDINADSGTFTGTLQAQTLTDGTVSLSGGELGDGSNSITMDGTDATVSLSNNNNSLRLDDAGAAMSASDGTTTGRVAVTESQASVTVDNGTATHGLLVGTSDTVLSGGTMSTKLTLNDAGAHLDNNLDMGNNRITNLANGIAPLDAVNRRQLDKVQQDLESAVAVVAAIAAVPAPMPGHRYSIGVGTGFYRGESSIAAGFNADLNDHLRLKGGVGSSSSETVTSVGIGFSW